MLRSSYDLFADYFRTPGKTLTWATRDLTRGGYSHTIGQQLIRSVVFDVWRFQRYQSKTQSIARDEGKRERAVGGTRTQRKVQTSHSFLGVLRLKSMVYHLHSKVSAQTKHGEQIKWDSSAIFNVVVWQSYVCEYSLVRGKGVMASNARHGSGPKGFRGMGGIDGLFLGYTRGMYMP